MRTSHKLLLKFWFDPRFVFSDVQIYFVDRGASGDLSDVFGDQILNLESQYLEIASGQGSKRIPYHRIVKILYAGKIAWER